MKGFRYQAIVDDRLIWESNSVIRCKEKADHELDYRNGYYAQIKTGNRVCASRFYDTKWTRNG